jgi:hypothetical protein
MILVEHAVMPASREPDWGRAQHLVAALPRQLVADHGDTLAARDLSEAQANLTEDLVVARAGWDHEGDGTVLRAELPDGQVVLVAGGRSGGEAPNRGYEALHRLRVAGVLDAAGFESVAS